MTEAFKPQSVLILGAARSGTTLLASMLGHHPDAAIMNENRRMEMQFITGKKVVGNKLLVPLEIRLNKRLNLLSRFLYSIGFVRALQSCGLHMKHFTGSFFSLEDYLKIDAIKVIGIVREPGPAISSIVTRDPPLARKFAIWNWSRSVEVLAILKERMGDRFMLVGFEQLVTQPADVMKEVCSFLGLEYTPQILDGCRFNPTSPEPGIRPGKAAAGTAAKDGEAPALRPDIVRLYRELTGALRPAESSAKPERRDSDNRTGGARK